MLDILTIIPGKKKHTQSGWHSFNAVCCHNRGHKRDTRGRAGIMFDGDANKWSYNCFNCQFKCGFQLGKSLTKNTRILLAWCGLSEQEIERINFESFSQRDLLNPTSSINKIVHINFDIRELPEHAVPLNPEARPHQLFVEYLASRGLKPDSYPYWVIQYATRNGIVIPYYYKDDIVGHTIRYCDDRRPKYLSDQQPGYVFNVDAQHLDWAHCILVEGQFDAISIGGCAYMGSNISDKQAALIAKLHRDIIVVPDHDSSGMSICDRALELGYRVSIPDWDTQVKDVNDAVKLYGKFPTLLSILESATNSKIKIEMRRKKYQ